MRPAASHVRVALPSPDTSLDQDCEWCLVDDGAGAWREVRFHDYAAIYEIPGLYERLFHDILQCQSPSVVAAELAAALAEDGRDPATLSALDLGAGNGMVGEEIRRLGVHEVIGVDLLDEAARAARRDRPGVYETYVAGDVLDPSPAMKEKVLEREFDILSCVAALGFGDVPTDVFTTAFERVRVGGLLAFNIKEDFLQLLDPTGFSSLIADLVRRGVLDVRRRRRYQHRLATNGEPIFYVAVVAEKKANL